MEINLRPFQELRGTLAEVATESGYVTARVVVTYTLRVLENELDGELPEPGCEIAILRTETSYVVTGARSKVASATLAIGSKP